MIGRSSHRFLLVVAAVVFGGLLRSPAHAQYYYVANAYRQPQPLYPYAQPQAYYPYAVQPQYAPRAYPYVAPNSGARVLHRQPAPRASERHLHRAPSRSRVDPALVEELRRRGGKARAKSEIGVPGKLPKIDRTIVVREKPIVVEHQRIVDDPPIIVRREKVIDVPAPEPRAARRRHDPKDEAAPRVIHAEAEVTILGPDRMSIRLFRKGRGLEANAKAKD